MSEEIIDKVRLRDVNAEDLPQMYQFNLDAESNALAGTNARSSEVFYEHWRVALADPMVVAKAIVVDGTQVGTISCFSQQQLPTVGYWLDRKHWGRGIASAALTLMLKDVHTRPLYAQVAVSNVASLRILQKAGFEIQAVRRCPADERYVECDVASLVLK